MDTSGRPWPPVAMAHGAVVPLPLLSLELPMLQPSGSWLEVLARGPPPPSSQSGRDASLKTSPQSLAVTMSAAPSPRQMALAEKDYW